ncbi:hypothetical protein BDW62DRAFT_213108 [Aspergillus aurantiobrunneus]
MRRVRRTEVACSECRRRKLKCEGTRPRCSRCQSLHLECCYVPPRNNRRTLEEKLQRVAEPSMNDISVVRISEGERGSPDQRTAIEEDVPVDILSTNALTETSDTEVGYFGPSSNYAIFRLVSRIFAQTTMMYLPADGMVPSLDSCHHCAQRHSEASTAATRNPEDTLAASVPGELYTLPSKEEATVLFDRYFSTINLALPYISRPALLGEVFLALLNIVWAHASASFNFPQREAFYKKSAGLLDSRTLERPSYELGMCEVQTLLLMVEYKQNHQRSISSYTIHVLCVKAAFHVGLYSAITATVGKPAEVNLRIRLWNGVVKTDRIMSLTQGRPFVIPQSLGLVNNEVPREASPDTGGLCMARLVSSHSIIEQAVGTLYNRNLELRALPKIPTMVSRWTDLSWQVGEWSDNLITIGGLSSPSGLPTCPNITDSHTITRVLLSIQYYRMRMLVNFPLIARFLLENCEASHEPRMLNHLRQRLPVVIRDDWSAVRELCGLISALMLTIALHYLAILLVTKQDRDILDASSAAGIRHEIEGVLGVVERFGKSSLITQNAVCCIGKLLIVFDTLGSRLDVAPSIPFDFCDADYVLENIGLPSSDFLATCGQDEFEQQNPSFLDLYSRIPLCE